MTKGAVLLLFCVCVPFKWISSKNAARDEEFPQLLGWCWGRKILLDYFLFFVWECCRQSIESVLSITHRMTYRIIFKPLIHLFTEFLTPFFYLRFVPTKKWEKNPVSVFPIFSLKKKMISYIPPFPHERLLQGVATDVTLKNSAGVNQFGDGFFFIRTAHRWHFIFFM